MKTRLPVINLLAFAVIVLLGIMILAGLAKSNGLKNENNELHRQVKEETARINETKDLLEAGEREIIERYARDKLGFGEKDQTVYYNITGD